MKTNCVIYCRVSSREQEETGYSLDAQEKLLKEYASKKTFGMAKTFRITESASGKQIRKTFNEMLQYAVRNKINIILCEKIDRLTRNLKDAATISDWINENPVHEIHFVKENFVVNKNTRAHENLVWDMKVAIARFYTNNLSEEVLKGQKEKISQGWLPQKPPLGYRTIGEKGHKTHTLDEEKAMYIRKAFEYYGTGNYSLRALRDKLYEEGLRTRGGNMLSKSRLAEILGDPFYYGAMRWRGITYPNGKHTPLIKKELFEQVQYLLTRKGAPHYKRHMFKFSKMVKCGECGGTINGEIQKGHVYYSCKHSRKIPCTQRGMTKEEDMEKMLMGVFHFFENVTSKEAEEIYQKIRADHQGEANYKETALHALNTRYNALQKQLDILYDDRLAERISQERWESKQNTINTEQAEIQEQVAKIKSEESKYFELYINILDLARRARAIYEKRSPEERRLLLSHLFANLTLKNHNVVYDLKEPVQVLAKRVQEKLDAEKIFEPKQNTAEAFASSGDLPNSSYIRSVGPSEVRNDIRTSRKYPVKERPRHFDVHFTPSAPEAGLEPATNSLHVSFCYQKGWTISLP